MNDYNTIPEETDDMSDGQQEVIREIKNARIESLEQKLEEKIEEIEELRETINELKEEGVDTETTVRTRPDRTMDGTPNRDEEIEYIMQQDPPSPAEFENLSHDEATLHNLIIEGPDALTVDHNPVYPVHERARRILIHAPGLGDREEINGALHIRLPLPDAKIHIETDEDTSIKHTQMRRVFEQLRDAGSDYPRPPILHKNNAGHLELVLFDYNALYETR